MQETTPKPFIFVLMPFKEEFSDIYELGIKAACEEAGAYCERVDEQIFVGGILERVYNQISKADLIVSDMSERNPNVFYETGYAHALGKQVILLTQRAEDIPFDLSHYPHIVYEGKIAKLKTELERRIHWFIEHPKGSLSKVEPHLQLFINGILLKTDDNPEIEVKYKEVYEDQGRGPYYGLLMKLDVYNPTQGVYEGKNVRIGVITSSYLPASDKARSVSLLPNENYIHILSELGTIFPECWESLDLVLYPLPSIRRQLHNPLYDRVEKIIIRVFSEIGKQDYPVPIRC
jgi:hypothetical protein